VKVKGGGGAPFEGPRSRKSVCREVQKLFERWSSGGVLTPAEIEAAVNRQRHRPAAWRRSNRAIRLGRSDADAGSPAVVPDCGPQLRRLFATLRTKPPGFARTASSLVRTSRSRKATFTGLLTRLRRYRGTRVRMVPQAPCNTCDQAPGNLVEGQSARHDGGVFGILPGRKQHLLVANARRRHRSRRPAKKG